MSSVAGNLTTIQDAVDKVTRKERTVKIVGVTKHQSIERIKEAISAGMKNLGVNYAQQGEVLMKELANESLEWHFIGHIQTRKVRDLTPYHCIQSLDRMEIALSLNDRLQRINKKISIFVEINIGREPRKSGIFPEKLTSFVDDIARLPQLDIRGLMCLPPPLQPPTARIPYFQAMKELYEQSIKEHPLEHLSMGTSDDFLVAVEQGATMIRLGTCLFGQRNWVLT